MERTNKIGPRILLLLVLTWLLNSALTLDFQPSFSPVNKGSNSAIEQIYFCKDAIVPVSESNIVFSPFGFQNSSVNEIIDRLNAALFSHNLRGESRFAQYLHFICTVGIKYRKSDLLFPSHYFW